MTSSLLHFVSHLTFLRKQFGIFRIINYLLEGSIFNKDQGEKLSVRLSARFKGFLNLSRTMKFVLDFCHRLSIGKIRYKFHGLRQICLGFPEHWPWSETNLSQISSALFLFVLDFLMLIITKLSI